MNKKERGISMILKKSCHTRFIIQKTKRTAALCPVLH